MNHCLLVTSPVICIMPENRAAEPSQPIHQTIHILDNWFDIGNEAVSAKNTRGLVITGNRFSSAELPVHTNACTEVKIEANSLAVRK